MVQSGTYASHPTVFLNQPFAAPHQSALPVPKSRQACQLPLGGSQGEETMRLYHPTYSLIPSACGRILSAPTTAAAEPPTGRLVVDPYSWCIPFNRVLSKIQGCGRILSAPTGRVQAGLACNTVTGWVRAVPYGYNSRSVIVRRFRRPYGWQQRSYGAAALPGKRFHSFRPHPPGTPGNHPGKIPA